MTALGEVPDPRHARGRRHAWPLILTLISAALLSGHRNVRALGQWVEERAEELGGLLQPPRGRLPSTATLRRALWAVDIEALECRVAAFVAGLASPQVESGWVGQAVDGKALRLRSHGHTFEFVLDPDTARQWESMLPPRHFDQGTAKAV